MITKILATGATLGALAFAGAALAQPSAYERDNIPSSSPSSPDTVNPMPERDWDGAPAVTEKSTVQSTGQAVVDYVQARTPLNADVAARLGMPIEIVASAPVPDTQANRARYGGPMSHAGKLTRPAGN